MLADIIGIKQANSANIGRYRSELNKARREDNNAAPAEMSGRSLHNTQAVKERLQSGDVPPEAPQYQKVSLTILREFQQWFRGRAFRRTAYTKGENGLPIWGADPPHEEKIILRLSEEEEEVVNQEADNAMDDKTCGWQKVSSPHSLPVQITYSTFLAVLSVFQVCSVP